MTTKKLSRLSEAFLESAEGMHRIGVMDDATYHKITIRHLGPEALSTAEPISGEEIRTLREQAHLSQAAFARYLNLTVGLSRSWSANQTTERSGADLAERHSPQRV